MAETQRKGIAFDQVWKSVTGVPAIDFKDLRYTAVNFNADEKITTAAAGTNAIGIIYDPLDIDQPAQVVVHGFAFCRYGAAVEAGQELEVGTGGKLIPLTTGKLVGTAAISAGADAIGTVLLK